ncbi:hypothetical protein EMIT0P228_10694 [Pseudomonas brassicacearum]
MGLRGTVNRHLRCFGLLAFMPEQPLLARYEGNQQRQGSPYALLEMQGREAQLDGTFKVGGAKLSDTLTIHPGIPPHPSAVIWLRRTNATLTRALQSPCQDFLLDKHL